MVTHGGSPGAGPCLLAGTMICGILRYRSTKMREKTHCNQAEIPGKDGEMKCVTYVKASSETADYIKALFEEMNTAA